MNIIAISGSLRQHSSNAALLRAAVRVAPQNVDIALYEGAGELPHFNPDLDAPGMDAPRSVHELRDLLVRASAVVISSPEYAHGVPGSLKNLLDWLVSVGELVGKPVAVWNAAPVGGQYAQASIVETLRTMNWRVVEEASLIEPFVTGKISGELREEAALQRLAVAIAVLANVAASAPPAESAS